MPNNDELNKKLIALMGNMGNVDQLIETLGMYLDAIIYLLGEKGIVNNDELTEVLDIIREQNIKDGITVDTTDNIDMIDIMPHRGFMEPTIGEA